jgi:hypothetical protein
LGGKQRRGLGRFASVEHKPMENGLKGYGMKAELLDFDSGTRHLLESHDEPAF